MIQQQEKIEKYFKFIKLRKKIIFLQEKLNNLGNISYSEDYTELDYFNINKLYEIYIHNYSICVKLGVEYKEDTLQKEINHIKQILINHLKKKYLFRI